MSCSPARFKSNYVCNCYKMHNGCQAGCDTFQDKCKKKNVASLTILAWLMGLIEAASGYGRHRNDHVTEDI